MKLRKLLTEDLEAGILRIKLTRALQEVSPRDRGPRRTRELHVSDIYGKDFCLRSTVTKVIRGDRYRGASTWVHLDGKVRESKWKALFEQAGILRDYQRELRDGILVGHPDFVIDMGQGERIVELTGSDMANPIEFRSMHLATKKRQIGGYMMMSEGSAAERGFIVVEAKGSNQFKIHVVERDEAMVSLMRTRHMMVEGALAGMRVCSMNGVVAVRDYYRALERCGNAKCGRCSGGEEGAGDERREEGGGGVSGDQEARAGRLDPQGSLDA